MENLDVPHRLKRGKTPPKVSRKRSELATKVITIVTTILTSKGLVVSCHTKASISQKSCCMLGIE